jgi:uncharacterized protein YndB with AHSA1/START domain
MTETDTELTETSAEGIRMIRVFAAPRQAVWDAWTDVAQFAQWFGERDSHIPLDTATMDVRVGARWDVIMVAGPDEQRIHFGGEYLEVVEPERLVLTLDTFGDGVETMTAVLTELEDGRTQMLFTQTGGNLPAEEYKAAAAGSSIFFERLAELVARG